MRSGERASSFVDTIAICDNVRIRNRATLSAPRSAACDPELLVPWVLSDSPSSPRIGLIRPDVLRLLQADNERNVKFINQAVWDIRTSSSPCVSFVSHLDNPKARSDALRELCARWRDEGLFADIIGPKKWRGELYPVYKNPFGPLSRDSDNYAFEMERSACALFGVITYGVHMTVYHGGASINKSTKTWVPTRSKTKQTWPGYCDNTVAGGISSGMSAFDSIVKEAEEEASLPAEIVRKHAKSVGSVSYFYRTKQGWLQPEVQFVYDLSIPPEKVNDSDWHPKPNDSEVESFELLPIEEVLSLISAGKYKANCALVIVDFLVRHGVITPENEPNYLEIVTRLHGRFDYEHW